MRIELQEKANNLIAWFADKKIFGPINLKPGVKITDPGKYIAAQVPILENYKSDPFNKIFVAAYYRLFYLKKYMENESTGAINGKA